MADPSECARTKPVPSFFRAVQSRAHCRALQQRAQSRRGEVMDLNLTARDADVMCADYFATDAARRVVRASDDL